MPHLPVFLPVLFLSASLAACSVAPPGTEIHDPYEPFNRQVHAFNKQLDESVLRPLARETEQAPEGLREVVLNFSGHAGLPGAVVNGLLQGDLEGAATNTARFLVNSTLGLMGLADPAAELGLTEVETDFGETLAVWGVPEGAYLELPGLGPSTERDAVGRLVDFVLDPFDRLRAIPEPVRALSLPAQIAEEVIERQQMGGLYDDILYGSADSYAQARLIWLQNRRFELGQTGADADVYFDPYAEAP
ncbi:Surface lipoprotein [Rubellimicrobium thermophilum DSM 16684]|uniref:Surface lipoprotein n=1 Tax=Rubellimicrobium thermophilum DSM 16684 TaxID=1123069 RepID=S9SF31_9RHOB|nr:VacJ family lipoprotein [Rubellimicrobium thermophilum]EPX84894.1 Surface lipoprotein [Rubellimicrobium thermophilum DSM 16684]